MGLMQEVATALTLTVLLAASGWAAPQVHHAATQPEMAWVEIAGQVVDDETGKPVEQFALQDGSPDAKDPNRVGWGGGTTGRWIEGKFSVKRGAAKGRKIWFRIVAEGYLPEPVTPEPLTIPIVWRDLVVRLRRGGELKGLVLDHAGKPVAGATVYLGGSQILELTNGENVLAGDPRAGPGTFRGSKAVTDKDGRFTLTGAGGDKERLVVVAAGGGLVCLGQPQPGKEQKIQLPQPGKVIIAYDIEGAAKEGLFRLELKTWEMPDWKGVVQTVQRVKCENGGSVAIDLTPGEYAVARLIESLKLGRMRRTAFCDRGTLKVEPGKTAKLEFIRAKGSPVSGQVIGLKETHALVTIRPEKATGHTLTLDEMKLPIYDALVTSGVDAEFKTARLLPGTYTVVAEAYEILSGRSTGIDLPSMVGTAKVTVPESGEAKPIRIELKPLQAAPTQPATRPAIERTTRKP